MLKPMMNDLRTSINEKLELKRQVKWDSNAKMQHWVTNAVQEREKKDSAFTDLLNQNNKNVVKAKCFEVFAQVVQNTATGNVICPAVLFAVLYNHNAIDRSLSAVENSNAILSLLDDAVGTEDAIKVFKDILEDNVRHLLPYLKVIEEQEIISCRMTMEEIQEYQMNQEKKNAMSGRGRK